MDTIIPSFKKMTFALINSKKAPNHFYKKDYTPILVIYFQETNKKTTISKKHNQNKELKKKNSFIILFFIYKLFFFVNNIYLCIGIGLLYQRLPHRVVTGNSVACSSASLQSTGIPLHFDIKNLRI